MRTAIGVVWMLLIAGQSLAADSTPNLINQCRTAVRLSAPARPPGVDTKDYIDASLCVGYLSGYVAGFYGASVEETICGVAPWSVPGAVFLG